MKVAYHTEWLRHRQEVVKQAFKYVRERGLSVSVYELAFQMLDNYFCNLYDPIDVTKQYITYYYVLTLQCIQLPDCYKFQIFL